MLTLLLLASLAVQDPVRVNARLTQDQVAAGETTVLRVEIETGGERAQIGHFTQLPPGVELVSTRNYDQRQFSIPGGSRRFTTREFVLRAAAAGRYRIPALDVVVDGRSYSTPSLLMTVTGPTGGTADAPDEGPAGEVVLRAWLATDTAYVGQQVTMDAEAMFSQTARLRLRRSPEYEPPSPSGFWIQELPAGPGTGTRVLNGQRYEVQGFRRAFFPLSPGEYEIPPARLEYEMRRGILYAPETFVLESDPMHLVVLPPPEEGRPEGFAGAVGRYAARGWVEPSEVPAGEAAVLTVEVQGRGNVRALPPPPLPDLEGAEVYPPTEEAESEVVGDVVRGVKRFSWVVIPRREGVLEIPEIGYPYFDPESREYEIASVAAQTLQVGPGGSAPVAGAPVETIRYVKTSPGGGDRLGWVWTPWFAAAQLLPLLGLGVGVLVRRGRRTGTSRREFRRRRKEGLHALEQRVDDDDPAFFPDLDRFVRDWLAARLALEPARAGDRDALASAGAGKGTAAGIATLLDRVASARYAPTAPGPAMRRDVLRDVGRLLERVDRDAPLPSATGAAGSRAGAPAGGMRAGSAVILAMCFLGVSGMLGMAGMAGVGGVAGLTVGGVAGGAGPPPRPVVQELERPSDSDAFAEGLGAFQAGRYGAAASAFDRYRTEAPDDAAGWYNLGTSYHQAGATGRAVWAWLRAVALAPRDGDTRHNLRVADVAPELVRRATPPIPLTASEMALLGSLLWFVAGLTGAVWLARRRPRFGIAAAVALAGAVVVGVAWLDSTRDAETLIVLDSVTLRAGPTLRGEPLTELEPGSGLVPVSPYNGWLRVRTLDGHEGWIETRSVGAL